MHGKSIKLDEGVGINQEIDALACRVLALGMLLFNGRFARRLLRLSHPVAEIGNFACCR